MIPKERQEFIKSTILQTKSVQVAKLAIELDVSEETIRRDLSDLEQEGIIKKVHGGAILANRVQAKVDNTVLKNIFVENKKQIALQAAKLINQGDSIFLDSSTTSLALCEEIKEMDITVLTNSIDIAHSLSSKDSKVTLLCAGGRLLKSRGCFVGSQTQKFLEHYSFDKLFFSCKSLDLTTGVTDSDDAEAEIKKVALNNSRKRILLADHSKFGRVSFAKICPLSDLTTLITDQGMDPIWLDVLSNSDVEFMFPQ